MFMGSSKEYPQLQTLEVLLCISFTVYCIVISRCRVDPYLIKCLLYYTDKTKISPQFLNEWKHYKKIGLPPIQ